MPTKFHRLSTLELAKIARTWSSGSNVAGPHWAYHFLGGTAYDFSFQGDYQGGRYSIVLVCQVWQVARVE